MKKAFLATLLAILLMLALSACGECDHPDRNGDGICDKCRAEVTALTTAATTLPPTPTTTAEPPEFPPDVEIAARIAAAIGNATLGAALDIGLDAVHAPYYTVAGEEEFVRVNADGMLEFVGARTRSTLLRVTGPQGQTVYEGFYSLGEKPFAIALRRALFAEGLIASTAADAPASAIARLQSFSLADAMLTDPCELSAIGYMTSLRTLVLSRSPLGDLSYLAGLSSLETLDLSYATSLSYADGGISIVSRLTSLPALRHVSIVGAYSLLNRPIFDAFVTMTANGAITLEPLAGYELGATEIDAFAGTVFFSVDELVTHLSRNGGSFAPGEGYSHAVLALSEADTGESGLLNVSSISFLELYGREGLSFGIPITSSGDLTVNLYSYHLRATRENQRSGIHADGALRVCAFGRCSVYGSGWDSPEVTYLTPGAALSGASVTVDTDVAGSITLQGGRGYIGSAGVTDGKDPTDITTTKNGCVGGLGAPGIRASGEVTIASSAVMVYGGKGGRGGDGADGSDVNIFFGGYNAGNGGPGGMGGPAVECDILVIDNEDYYNCLIAGNGGSGGIGGTGFLGGTNGNPGRTGDCGDRLNGRRIVVP